MPTELHVGTTRIRRTSGRRPVSFKQSKDLSHIAVCVGQCVSLGELCVALQSVTWPQQLEASRGATRASELTRSVVHACVLGVRTDTARSFMLSAASAMMQVKAKCTERLSGNVKERDHLET